MTEHTVTYSAVYTVTIDGVEHQLKESAGAYVHPKTGKVLYEAPERVRDEERDLSKRINYAINLCAYEDSTESILNLVWELTN